MTTCRASQRWFSPYLDGSLEALSRGELETHLKACSVCAGELEALKKLLVSLRSLGEVEAPNDLLAGVHAKLTTEPRWNWLLARWPAGIPRHGFAVAVTATLVVCVVAIPLFLRQGGLAKERLRLTSGAMTSERSLGSARQLGEAKQFKEARVAAKTMRALDEIPTRLAVQWRVKDPQEAVRQVTDWVRARQGSVVSAKGGHLELQLAQVEVPAFLQQFSSVPLEGFNERTARESAVSQPQPSSVAFRESAAKSGVALAPEARFLRREIPAESLSPQPAQSRVLISLELVPSE